VNKFAERFIIDADHRLMELKGFALTAPKDQPRHEWSWHIPPDAKSDDPFNVAVGISLTAIRVGDVATFQQALQTALSCGDQINIERALTTHVSGALFSICKGTVASDSSGMFSQKFLDVTALYLSQKAAEGLQTSVLSSMILSQMVMVAESCLKEDRFDLALVPVVVIRQVVQKGLDGPLPAQTDDKTSDPLFLDKLSQITYMTMQLAQTAIRLKNSDFLYRCLDSFGYLGCSAVKHNNLPVGRTCLRALAQLGREARANSMECFWDRCALTPTDHAQERIEWMISWLPSAPENCREMWIRSMQEAYSRIIGRETTLTVSFEDSKPTFNLALSEKSFQLNYAYERIGRVLDYSDFTVLKDLELY
jgi:hypothetical protein